MARGPVDQAKTMIGGELLRTALRLARCHWPGFSFGPGPGEGQPYGPVPGMPLHEAEVWREDVRHTGVRALRARRRQQGFLAGDVRISMYLGTRGVRDL